MKYFWVYNLGFRIGFGNINGVSERKSENDIYQKYINKFDIIFLSETWESETSTITLQHPLDYLHVNIARKPTITRTGYHGIF